MQGATFGDAGVASDTWGLGGSHEVSKGSTRNMPHRNGVGLRKILVVILLS